MAAWIVAARDLCIRPGCQHADGVMPLFGLLSRRGVVYCAQCLILAQMDDMAARPNECDSCGKETEIFAESTSKISTVITVVGHLCGDCDSPRALPWSPPRRQNHPLIGSPDRGSPVDPPLAKELLHRSIQSDPPLRGQRSRRDAARDLCRYRSPGTQLNLECVPRRRFDGRSGAAGGPFRGRQPGSAAEVYNPERRQYRSSLVPGVVPRPVVSSLLVESMGGSVEGDSGIFGQLHRQLPGGCGLGRARAPDPPTGSSAPRRRSRGRARATAWSGGAAPGRRWGQPRCGRLGRC